MATVRIFPVWVRTYCALPGKLDKNVLIIAEEFYLDTVAPEQAETLLSSVAIGLSYQRKVPMDNVCTEHEVCKFGRMEKDYSHGVYRNNYCMVHTIMIS